MNMSEEWLGEFLELKETVCQHEILISQQQCLIEEQSTRLHDLEILLGQLTKRLAPAEVAVPTVVSQVASWDSWRKEGTVKGASEGSTDSIAKAFWQGRAPDAAEDTVAAEVTTNDPWVNREDCSPAAAEGTAYQVECHMCGLYTAVCPDAQYDDSARAGCLRMQGWTRSQRVKKWRCTSCTLIQCCPQRLPEWPLACCERHASAAGSSPPPPPPLSTVSPRPTNPAWEPLRLTDFLQ